MRYIFFDGVKAFITNIKYDFVCDFYVRLSPANMILIYCIKIDHDLL